MGTDEFPIAGAAPMSIADRLTIAGIGVVLGLIAVFGYVAITPIFTSWVNVAVVQVIFTAVYTPTVIVLRRRQGARGATA